MNDGWRLLGHGLIAFVFGCLTLAAAQDTGLVALRAKFDADILGSTLPVLKQQVVELAALEKKAASARDYDAAIAIRNERERVEAEISSQAKLLLLLEARQQSVTGKTPDRILLRPAEAKLEGVRYDTTAGALTDWKAAGATATWRLPDLPPGGYEVVLHYSSGPLEGGSLRVQESFYSLTSDLSTTLKGYEDLNLGTLRVRDGAGLLKISAVTVLKSNLMQLQSVELLPANR
jgi:hypothetical protein